MHNLKEKVKLIDTQVTPAQLKLLQLITHLEVKNWKQTIRDTIKLSIYPWKKEGRDRKELSTIERVSWIEDVLLQMEQELKVNL